MDAWCVLLEEPSPGRVPDLRPVHYCESRELAVEQALKFAREFEPLEPAQIVGRRVFRAAGDTYLVLFEGLTTRRFVRLHIVENLT
ncbi:hypothetical protein [Flindersiella endophytica]